MAVSWCRFYVFDDCRQSNSKLSERASIWFIIVHVTVPERDGMIDIDSSIANDYTAELQSAHFFKSKETYK